MGSRSWTDEQLIQAVPQCNSYRDVVRALGLSTTSAGNWTTVKTHIQRLNLDTSHFKPRNTNTSAAVLATRKSDEEVFCENSAVARSQVRKRILAERPRKCQNPLCGIETWLGEDVPLELEHINGVGNDHRRENLLLLCPNCHALTPTWRGRNRKKVSLCACGESKYKKAKTCAKCVVREPRYVIDWPNKDDLALLVRTHGYSGTGRLLGVSDNAVRKHLKTE